MLLLINIYRNDSKIIEYFSAIRFMKKIKIEDEKAFNEIFSSINLFDVFEGVIKINYEKMKIY